MTHVWHDSYTRLLHTGRRFWTLMACLRCDMTHSHVWHDSFICVTWLIDTCGMNLSNVWHDSFTCVTCLSLTHETSCTCVTWLINMCGTNLWHEYVWHDSFICVIWLTLTHDSFTCVWHNSLVCDAYSRLEGSSTADMIHSHDSFIHDVNSRLQQHVCVRDHIFYSVCVGTWLIPMCDMIHSHDSFIHDVNSRLQQHVCIRDHIFFLCVLGHDSFTCVTWFIHMTPSYMT